MPLVSPDVAEQAWKRVGALDEAAALELQQRSGTFQPELVGFVLGFIHNLSPEAMGIALYATLVVFEMFQRAVPRIKKVKERTIVRLWHENRRAVDDLFASEFDEDLMTAFVSDSAEPAALQYVVDAMVDAQDDSDELEAEEVAHVLAVLKTVIDALHQAPRP